MKLINIGIGGGGGGGGREGEGGGGKNGADDLVIFSLKSPTCVSFSFEPY